MPMLRRMDQYTSLPKGLLSAATSACLSSRQRQHRIASIVKMSFESCAITLELHGEPRGGKRKHNRCERTNLRAQLAEHVPRVIAVFLQTTTLTCRILSALQHQS